jgi:hypothetical protein
MNTHTIDQPFPFSVIPNYVRQRHDPMSAPPVTVPPDSYYFGNYRAYLSTVGIANLIIGLHIGTITGWSKLLAVPIATSSGVALANGLAFLCYEQLHPSPPTADRIVANVFADIAYLVRAMPRHTPCN